MAIGFKKSLFGFHCGEVTDYISRADKAFKEKEKELAEKNKALASELEEALRAGEAAEKKNQKLNEELAGYREKAEEIKRLSENIGKLYLVAQANADAIMKNSQENSEAVSKEIEKNISSIEGAHSSLTDIKNRILSVSDGFVTQLNELMGSLNSAKHNIQLSSESNHEKISEFNQLIESMKNENI